MKYRIVQMVDGSIVVTESTDIFTWAAAAGVEIVKLNANPRQRAELQGVPILATFCGPMWDGDAIRYEDSESNDVLST